MAALQAAVKQFNAQQNGRQGRPQAHPRGRLHQDVDHDEPRQARRTSSSSTARRCRGWPTRASWRRSRAWCRRRRSPTRPTRSRRRTPTPATTRSTASPSSTPALGLYGNKKLLDAAGVKYPKSINDAWTADQFDAALKALAAEDPDEKVLDLKENYAGTWPMYAFLPIVNSTGNVVVKDNKAQGNLNSPAVVEAAQQLASWRSYVDPNTDDKAFTARSRRALVGRALGVHRLLEGLGREPARAPAAQLRRRVEDRAGLVRVGHQPGRLERQGRGEVPRLPHERRAGEGDHRHQRRPPGHEDASRRSPSSTRRAARSRSRASSSRDVRERPAEAGLRRDPAARLAGLSGDAADRSPTRSGTPTTARTPTPSSARPRGLIDQDYSDNNDYGITAMSRHRRSCPLPIGRRAPAGGVEGQPSRRAGTPRPRC